MRSYEVDEHLIIKSKEKAGAHIHWVVNVICSYQNSAYLIKRDNTIYDWKEQFEYCEQCLIKFIATGKISLRPKSKKFPNS